MSRKLASILAMGAMMASLPDLTIPSEFANGSQRKGRYPKRALSPKQAKARKRNKASKKSRKINRKSK